LRPGDARVPAECFAIYRQRYFRNDPATAVADRLRLDTGPAPVTALHTRARDLPLAAWRRDIYDRAHLADRLSLVYAPAPHTAFAINLYRDASRGAFGSREIDALLAVSPLLRSLHRARLQRRPEQPPTAVRSIPAQAPALPLTVEAAHAALARRAPALSVREREVCARIACGMSADGIAADLDIAPSTVATLRKRAYVKLAEAGLHGGRWRLAHRLMGG
jgi:DNA-binding CsgD family transcriptional regulator